MNTKELTEVIRIYCEKDFPGYAIMINGPWGIGKTYFLKQLIKESEGMRAVHVSLYGVSSTSQIDDSIFAALVGCADVGDSDIKRAGEFIGKLFSAFGDKAEGSAAGAIASLSGEALKKRTLKNISPDTVIVFDDFERSKLLQHETLSKINEFVEHQGLKVIILCDERAVKDKKYTKTKEKVILYTNGFKRSAKEIVQICFDAVGDIKCDNVDYLKTCLTNTVEQFSLTNIRTIKHGLQCFKEITNKIVEIDARYKGSSLINEILYSAVVFAVGYRDYGVPIVDLEKTVTNSSELAVSFHLRNDKKRPDEETSLTSWERFYTEVLSKASYRIEINSVFELICRGYLSVSAINDDLNRWQARRAKPDSPVTDFRIDQPISDSDFAVFINEAIGILDNSTYAFYSTAELYSFCQNLKFLHDHRAFSFTGNFDEKLMNFAKVAVGNCINHTEPSAFGCKDSNYDVLKSIFHYLAESSDKLSSNLVAERARKKLLDDLNQGGVTKIVDSGDNAFSKPIINSNFISQLKEMYPSLDNVSIRSFGIFIKKRFHYKSDHENYQDEIKPLTELLEYLEAYLRGRTNSISTMMTHILRDTVESVIQNAETYKKNDSLSD